jgi:hypothetical protein
MKPKVQKTLHYEKWIQRLNHDLSCPVIPCQSEGKVSRDSSGSDAWAWFFLKSSFFLKAASSALAYLYNVKKSRRKFAAYWKISYH